MQSMMDDAAPTVSSRHGVKNGRSVWVKQGIKYYGVRGIYRDGSFVMMTSCATTLNLKNEKTAYLSWDTRDPMGTLQKSALVCLLFIPEVGMPVNSSYTLWINIGGVGAQMAGVCYPVNVGLLAPRFS